MRVTNTITFKQLRALLGDYEIETGTKFNYDRMVSKSIFAAGYLQFVHHKWINRDELLDWMLEQTDDEAMRDKIHIYPRRFYDNSTNEFNKTETEVVVIDGSLDHKKQVLDFLYNIEWSDKYELVNFIPWHTSADFSKTDQVEAIRDHNEYMSILESEILKIKHPDAVLQNDGYNEIKFTKWLESKTYMDINLFYTVEKIGTVDVLIAYPKENAKTISNMIEQLHQILEEDFDHDAVTKVFGNNERNPIKRIKPKTARSHLAKLKQKMGNPQGSEDDSAPPKVHGYYGRPPVSAQQVDKTFAQAVGSKPTSTPPEQHEPTEINQLTKKLQELQKNHDQLKKSLTKNIATEVLSQVDTKIEKMEKTMNKKIEDNKTAVQTQFSNFLQDFQNDNKQERLLKKKEDEKFREQLLAAIAGKNTKPNQPPSGVDEESARGGNK